MKLSIIERESALWLKISEELTNRLGILREKNDGTYNAEETANIRGEIKAIKQMLDWAKPLPAISDHDL